MSNEQVAPETKGVTVKLLATVDLGPEIEGMTGRQLRMRMVTIEPEGVFGPIHDHKDRPGIVYTLEHDARFIGKFDWITVSRGINGPIFDDVPASVIGDPTVDSIKSKFSKNYQTIYPLHLLAYIDVNPMLPDHIWQSNASKYIENNIKQSQFDKVWIFDSQREKIKYSYP
jgi:hypothetical protein